MTRAVLRLFFLFAIVSLLPAAPITRDLGQGLTYVRAAVLPADLPTAGSLNACVLDLRTASGDTAAAEALAAWLKFRASPRTPVYVLANAATAGPLRQVLAADRLPAGTLTIGLAGGAFTPDIAVAGDPESERNALAALAAGQAPLPLLQENAAKTRYDEATMVRELKGGAQPADDEPEAAPAAPPPLVDRVLQRAVQVHRGLAVLKRTTG